MIRFTLPNYLAYHLEKNGIKNSIYRYKNASYQILYQNHKLINYYVMILSRYSFTMDLIFLNEDNRLLVINEIYLQENSSDTVQQIVGCINNDTDSYLLKSYPPGFLQQLPYDKNINVGKGIYPWPDKFFSPYVDITAWPTYKIADKSKDTGVKFYNLGFVVSKSATECVPTWGTYYDIDKVPCIDQIKKLRENGGDIAVSFGGAANIPVHVNAPNDTTLKNIYKDIIMLYSLRRIDFDIEGIWIQDKKSNIRNASALKMLQDELADIQYSFDVWFTLPTLVTGLTPDGLTVLSDALKAGVNIKGVNVMAMDYGAVISDMGAAAIEAVTNLHSQLNTLYNVEFSIPKTQKELWQMIGATPMIGKNDVQGEVFYPDNAETVLDFAKAQLPGQLSMWSCNRDNSKASGVPQKEDDFSKAFEQYSL